MVEATVATQAISSAQIHAIEEAKQKHETEFDKWFENALADQELDNDFNENIENEPEWIAHLTPELDCNELSNGLHIKNNAICGSHCHDPSTKSVCCNKAK